MAEVSLYNHAGISDTYAVGRGIRLYTEDGAIQDFFPGTAEEITVELDFSNGDMIVEPSNDTVFEKVNISKPANLIPENIAEGVDVAGIVGTLVGSSGNSFDGESIKYLAYQIDDVNKEIIVHTVLWTQLYVDTGGYNITIPDAVGEYEIIISAQGVS